MRRIGLVVAMAGLLGVAGCYGGGQKASSGGGGSGTQKGVAGQFYFVNIPTPPVGGIVTSDVGGISCGASSQSVSGGAYVFTYYSGASACGTNGQTQIPWAQAVTLTATPQGTNAFIGWAGDCSGTGTCTLDTSRSGADKTVVAIFGPPGSGHGNFMSPAVHAPAYFGFLSGTSPLRCNTCHGPTLAGQGIAPSCNDCHQQAGWANWQSNCSFCHGAKTPDTQPGYAFASHPEWSAPPAAISQRLTGTPAPDRTGAHQTHLLGETPTGFSVAKPFKCETCHPVPTDLSHVSGSAARANVVLTGAGQASLPANLGTYDQASGTCTTRCHGASVSPAWSSTGMACGACHGVPPPSPHPYTGTDMTACYACHSETLNTDGSVNVDGGKHVDGIIQATGHGDWTSPAIHGPRFFDYLGGAGMDCRACHGANLDGGIGPSCNSCHVSAGWTASWQTNCSFCHGAKTPDTQPGYTFASNPEWSAPPDAISQRLSGTPAPDRTGAHQTHLLGHTPGGFSVAKPFKCETCHPVPTDLSHVSGSSARANVALAGAGQASLPASLGTYDQASGTCTTWCHGASVSPAWSSTGMACGACHGVPPPSPHPYTGTDMSRCYACHSETLNTDGSVNVSGGKHVDGIVQGMGHPDWTSPALHGPRFFDYLGGTGIDCKSCHGATLDGGVGPSCNSCHFSAGWTASWQTNCSFCHGTRNPTTKTTFYSVVSDPLLSAPPDAISQRLTGTADPARTGAHVAHLTGRGSATNTYFSAPFPCATCHAIPTSYVHASGQRAQVAFAGTGAPSFATGTWNQGAATCTTYCHGSTIVDINGQTKPPPTWAAGEMGCSSCHGMPSLTGEHELHVLDLSYPCYACHSSTVNSSNVVIGNHVNGTVTITFPVAGTTWNGTQCSSVCHDGGEWRTW